MLYQMTIHEARDRLAAGEFTAVELAEAVLERILAVDNDVKAYLTLTPEEALTQARAADERRATGEGASHLEGGLRGVEDTPLLGIPLAIKDVLCTKGISTTRVDPSPGLLSAYMWPPCSSTMP